MFDQYIVACHGNTPPHTSTHQYALRFKKEDNGNFTIHGPSTTGTPEVPLDAVNDQNICEVCKEVMPKWNIDSVEIQRAGLTEVLYRTFCSRPGVWDSLE